MAHVINVSPDGIDFNTGESLFSEHQHDCCEDHWLSFNDLSIDDFSGLEFDLSGDSFFERVPDFGIRLIPTNGLPVSIPGYSENNGYYSDNLTLVLSYPAGGPPARTWDITNCQSDF